MSRGALQTMFGVAIGLIARLALPGHHPMGQIATGLLSLAGAVGGSLAGVLATERYATARPPCAVCNRRTHDALDLWDRCSLKAGPCGFPPPLSVFHALSAIFLPFAGDGRPARLGGFWYCKDGRRNTGSLTTKSMFA